jgi:hypothetical protein
MTSQFIAKPPLAMKGKSLLNYVWRGFVSLGYILWQVVVPFKSSPEKIEPFPEAVGEVDDQQVKQSQWIFDQAEERRVHLEQKAQSTFGLMLFLVPLLASLFVFMSGKVSNSGGASRTIAVVFLVGSAVFLFLGFISAVRAVGIRNIEALYLGSVLDESGQFRKYSKAFHAYGLLYCAAMNQAMNDHRAQFVKGAQLFTAVAVVGLVITAIPAGLVLSRMPSSPSEIKIVGPVDVSSQELRGLREELRSLKADLQTLLSNRENRLKDLEPKKAKVDAKSNHMDKSTPVRRLKHRAKRSVTMRPNTTQ